MSWSKAKNQLVSQLQNATTTEEHVLIQNRISIHEKRKVAEVRRERENQKIQKLSVKFMKM